MFVALYKLRQTQVPAWEVKPPAQVVQFEAEMHELHCFCNVLHGVHYPTV